MEFFMPMRIPTATAQEKKINRKTGTIYPDAAVKAAKEKYLAHLDRFKPEIPLNAPIYLMVIWYFHSDKHPDKSHKITKPDTDNMIKLLQDVLGDLEFFKVGDQQIGDLRIIKKWSEEPYISIEIEPTSEAYA